MRAIVLILLICLLAQTAAFSELTKDDLEAIQKIVKAEIAASEQRTGDKLTAINTEIANIKTDIKVVKTDVQGVKDRLGDIRGLVIGVIGLIAIIIVAASAVTYAAGKLGATAAQLDKIYASNDRTNELIEQDTETRQETNRLLDEYTKQKEQFNEEVANIETHLEELRSLIKEAVDEGSNDPTAHAPAD